MRHLVLGNRSLTVLIDKSGKLRDFYFPHVGQENHLEDYKLGVFADNRISWVDEQEWQINSNYLLNSPITKIRFYIQNSYKILRFFFKFRINLFLNNLAKNTFFIHLHKKEAGFIYLFSQLERVKKRYSLYLLEKTL